VYKYHNFFTDLIFTTTAPTNTSANSEIYYHTLNTFVSKANNPKKIKNKMAPSATAPDDNAVRFFQEALLQ